MLSAFCHEGRSASPRCQHSHRTQAGEVVFPSLCRNQVISQVVAHPDGVGDLFEISSRRFYKTVLWIGLDKLNTIYEVIFMS